MYPQQGSLLASLLSSTCPSEAGEAQTPSICTRPLFRVRPTNGTISTNQNKNEKKKVSDHVQLLVEVEHVFLSHVHLFPLIFI